jgi:hypothetical protein
MKAAQATVISPRFEVHSERPIVHAEPWAKIAIARVTLARNDRLTLETGLFINSFTNHTRQRAARRRTPRRAIDVSPREELR